MLPSEPTSTMSVKVPPMSTPADRGAAVGGGGGVDSPGLGVDQHAVIGRSFLGREQLVAHVAQHRSGIALKRIAPSARTGEDVAENVTAFDCHCELRW